MEDLPRNCAFAVSFTFLTWTTNSVVTTCNLRYLNKTQGVYLFVDFDTNVFLELNYY